MKNTAILLCLVLASSTLFAEGKVSLRVSHISHHKGGIPAYYSEVLELKVYGQVQSDPLVKGLAKELPGIILLGTHKREKHKLIADCAKKAEDAQRAKKVFVIDLFMDNPGALAKKIGHDTDFSTRRTSAAFDLSLEDSDFKRIECSIALK